MKRSEIIEENFDKIVDTMIDLDVASWRYQVDLYLYPDGTIVTFDNVGGNSHLNDDHIRVWSCNNEYADREGCTEEEIRDACNDVRGWYENELREVIRNFKLMGD